MTALADYTTTEIGNSRLRLRSDLQFSMRTYEGEPCYLIEDSANSRFFRIGVSEYMLISMFDGLITVDEASAATATTLGENAFNPDEIAQICKWLVESELAVTDASETADRMYEGTETKREQKLAGFSNPIMIQTKLGNPDRLVAWLTKRFGWLVTSALLPLWLAVCGYGSYLVISDWVRFSTATSNVLAKSNWLLLMIVWISLKIVHEAGHAITCKKFGGSVNKFGIVWLMFIPMPYVDVSSSWSFESKRRRILTASAGMIVEMFVAGIAAIVWSHTEIGLLNQMAANIVITGSVVTLLFNANPLMRFDGYYIFSDLTNTPNLAVHARQWLHGWLNRVFLGIKSAEQDWPEGRQNLIRVYAVVSFIWRIMISFSLVFAAANLLEGFGLLLAILSLIVWFGVPAEKFVRYLIFGSKTSAPNRFVFLSRAGGLALLVLALLMFVPSPATIRAPAFVDYGQVTNVRSLTSGFVEGVFVDAGQQVIAGQLLARLRNDALSAELQEMRIKADLSRQQARIYQEAGELVAFQIAESNAESMDAQIAELQKLVDGLELRAAVEGKVVSADLNSLQGRYLKRGETVCRIAADDRRIVTALVAQKDLKSVRNDLQSDVSISVWGTGEILQGKIDRIEPRATDQLVHPALAAPSGGPLAVVASRHGKSAEQTEAEWRLAEPRVTIECSVGSSTANRLRAGQIAEVRLHIRDESLGNYLWSQFQDWLNTKIRINHGI